MIKFKTACQDRKAGKSAVKSLSQRHNRIALAGFKLRLCQSQSRGSMAYAESFRGGQNFVTIV